MVKDALHRMARWFAPTNIYSGTLTGTVSEQFHRIYYDTVKNCKWLGHSVTKNPFDLWTYQEVLFDTKPTLIVECGTDRGGSALFFASILEMIGGVGAVLSIDNRLRSKLPKHRRIKYMEGSSVNQDNIQRVYKIASGRQRVMVVLDSDHSKAHVAKEIDTYSPIVTQGCYLVVEDTNVNGNPVFPEHGPGPMEAVKDFLCRDARFNIDKGRERHGMTFNPNGWLKRQ